MITLEITELGETKLVISKLKEQVKNITMMIKDE